MDSNNLAKNAATEYSKYLDLDLENKLIPVNKTIESMLAHLEEFDALTNLTIQDVDESTQDLSSLIDFNDELQKLCLKIDTVEKVVNHIKGNLFNLEGEIEKAEQKLGLNNDKKLVTNILNPLLFKKSTDKKNIDVNVPKFQSNLYFNEEFGESADS